MEHHILDEFKASSKYRMDESLRMVRSSLHNLDEEDIWQKPGERLNSIGNLILHLCGNIGQYIISSLGETEDIRDRDLEFSTAAGYSKDQLFEKLSATIEMAKEVIENTTAHEMTEKRMVQGFNLSGIGIIVHVVEHLSYHTGQIAFWVKFLKNRDLGFYRGMNLNTKNQ